MLISFFFALPFLALFLGRLWAERSLRHIVCTREVAPRAFLGERMSVTLRVRNQGLLPLVWLRIHESIPVQLKAPNFFQRVLSLLPYEETTLRYDLDCRRRGYYLLGPLVLNSGDLFGMSTYEKRADDTDAIRLSRIVPL